MVNIRYLVFFTLISFVSISSADVIVQPGYENKEDPTVGRANPLRPHFNIKSRIYQVPLVHRPSLLPHCSHFKLPSLSTSLVRSSPLVTKLKSRRLLGSPNPNTDEESASSEEEDSAEESESTEARTAAPSTKRVRERKRKVKKNVQPTDADPSLIDPPSFLVDIVNENNGERIANAVFHSTDSRWPREDQQSVNVKDAIEFYKTFRSALQSSTNATYNNSQQSIADVNSLAGMLDKEFTANADASRNAVYEALNTANNQVPWQSGNYNQAYRQPQWQPPPQMYQQQPNPARFTVPAARQGSSNDLASSILSNIGRNVPAAAPYLQNAAAQTANWISAARGATPLNNAIASSAGLARQNAQVAAQPAVPFQQSYRNLADNYINYLSRQNPPVENTRPNVASYSQPSTSTYGNSASNYLNHIASYFGPQVAPYLKYAASETANWADPNSPARVVAGTNARQNIPVIVKPQTQNQLGGNIASDTLNYIAQNVPQAAPYLKNAATQTSNWMSAAQDNRLTNDAILGSVRFGKNPVGYYSQ